jgi:glycosyltransferase involved in cell wall biosynthesis
MGLKKNFIFTGWVPYEDMPFFMNIAKINAVPIPDAPATQGVLTLKLFEAMACGTPTIISDLPGVREHMKHKVSAYLIKSEDKVKYSNGIIELLGNKTLCNKLRNNGLKIVKNYDWRAIANDMAEMMLG